jgi:Family of unknown function (DUF6279)
MRLRNLTLVVVMISFLAACSLSTVAYNNAVPLLSWFIDDYFDLQDEQRDFAKGRLAILLAWHRHSELPEYHRLLEDAIRHSDGPVTGEEIGRLYSQGKTFAARLGERALGDIADFLQKLDAGQIKTLEARLAKGNEKFEREHLKPPYEKRLEARTARYVENLESWLGALTHEQRDYVELTLRRMPLTDEMRFAERKRLQAEFLAALKSRPPREQLIARVRVLMLKPEQLRAADYRAETERWQHEVPALVAWVVDRATVQQRAHLQNKLRGYSDDVAALMRDAA